MANILVVDDELGIRELLFEILNDEGHQVELAENAAQARAARQNSRPDLVLLDIWMPDTDGITLLKEWAANGQLTMPVVMMSGHGTIETAVEARFQEFFVEAMAIPHLTAPYPRLQEAVTLPARMPPSGEGGVGRAHRTGRRSST